jgi:hypothetical protein
MDISSDSTLLVSGSADKNIKARRGRRGGQGSRNRAPWHAVFVESAEREKVAGPSIKAAQGLTPLVATRCEPP